LEDTHEPAAFSDVLSPGAGERVPPSVAFAAETSPRAAALRCRMAVQLPDCERGEEREKGESTGEQRS
jgi:hypothetical protein